MYKFENLIYKLINTSKSKKNRSELSTLCPYHADKSVGSFSINLESGLYNCYSCGATGNIIKFVKEQKGLIGTDIVNYINKELGYQEFDVSNYQKKEKKYLLHEFDVIRNLRNPKESLEENRYLSRKFTKSQVEKLQAIDNIFTIKESVKYGNIYVTPDDLIIDFGSGMQVIKPEKDHKGNDKWHLEGSKYQQIELINNPKKEYILCEGAATAFAYYLCGYNAVICFSTSGLLSLGHLYQNIAYKTFVSEDNDEGGQKACKQLFKTFGYNIIKFDGRDRGFDACDYLRDEGVEKLIEHFNAVEYDYVNFLKTRDVRIYVNSENSQYSLIIDNTIYKIGKSKTHMIDTLIEQNKWYKNPPLKKIKALVTTFIAYYNIKKFNGYSYNPSLEYSHDYIIDDFRFINEYKKSGLINYDYSNKSVANNSFVNIEKLIKHLTEYNDEYYEWFLNFLAYKIQNPVDKPHIGILFYSSGIGGTGKSTLVALLKLMFGANINPSIEPESFSKEWNEYLFNCLLWVVEECKFNFDIVQRLKAALSSDTVEKRQRGEGAIPVENYANGIFTSDNPMPFKIHEKDRRMVVFQTSKSIDANVSRLIYNAASRDSGLSEELLKEKQSTIEEVKNFICYLINYKATKPVQIVTESMKQLVELGKDRMEEVIMEFVDDNIDKKILVADLHRYVKENLTYSELPQDFTKKQLESKFLHMYTDYKVIVGKRQREFIKK